MSVAYKKDEIKSTSEIARSFGKNLSDITTGKKERIVICKNNKLEAIIIPVEDYEYMEEMIDLIEHIEIFKLLKQRQTKNKGKRISLDTLLRREEIEII